MNGVGQRDSFFYLVLVAALLSTLLACGAEPERVSVVSATAGSALGRRFREAWNGKRAKEVAAAMNDATLAAQVLMTAVNGSGTANEETRRLLQTYPVGGLMLFKYNMGSSGPEVRSFVDSCVQAASSGAVPVAPFVAVDHEGGAVHRFGSVATRLPAPLRFAQAEEKLGRDGALGAVRESARLSGRELRALGVTMNLAPVAEPLDEFNRVFLVDRGYGQDPVFVAAAAAAFVQGMDAAGISCVLKHFPGNSGADPHTAAAALAQDLPALELGTVPFAQAIRVARPAAVMVSHAVVSAVDPALPASLSAAVLRHWLRDKLDFSGIVLADDFRMGAIAAAGFSPAQAAVRSLAAGADMVMTWPGDLPRVHAAVLQALADGTLPRDRLRDAVRRIVAQKLRYRLEIPRTDTGPAPADHVLDIKELGMLKDATEQYLAERGLR